MEEGMIAKWHKHVGDFVKPDELLFEVATDKATVEYNALDGGWLRKIIIQEGQTAVVNEPVAVFTEEKEEGIEGYQPEGVAPKVTVEVPSEEQVQPEQSVSGQPAAAKVAPSPSSAPAMRQPAFQPEPPVEDYFLARAGQPEQGERIKASPLARKLAKQQGLDLSSVKGTGPGSRIVSRDLSGARPLGGAATGFRQLPKEAPGSYTEESLTPMRKVISQRLQDAKSFIPHFYVSLTIDAQPLVQMREQLQSHHVKLTYNDFVVRACALALRQHPHVNSGFDSTTNSLIRFKTVDISIAVSMQGGLITPIVRHADFKSILEISAEVKELAARAKEGKLEPHEYKGGSFTISNLGMYGVSDFIAIINPPQAAILAVSGIRSVPVVREGVVVPGKELTVTLSGDHRVIDGVAGAEFLVTFQKLLERPAVLLIN